MNPKIRYNSSELGAIPRVPRGRKAKPGITEAWLFNNRNRTVLFSTISFFYGGTSGPWTADPNPDPSVPCSTPKTRTTLAVPVDAASASRCRGHTTLLRSWGVQGRTSELRSLFCSGADSSWSTLLIIDKVFFMFVVPKRRFPNDLLWVPPQDNSD